MKQYFVYILMNKLNTVIYVGITNNLERRVYEHKNKLVKGFTEKYNVNKLVYYEIYEDSLTAITREKTMKNLLRTKKLLLIQKQNHDFHEIIV
ncbi:MAG TPA: GIY-YIG nuclease family protein [Candidatus Eisenbacteria bacterium]|nr:GIY-YIG nuclease family protein [Candidatus Eisenbacteria bacterium]